MATRLEQAAEPGEVLVGQPTLALVREAVEVELVEPLELKRKAEPVPAYCSYACGRRRSEGHAGHVRARPRAGIAGMAR